MPKNVEKMSTNYSPNFDIHKRSKKNIKYIVYHYTGMKTDNAAIKRLTKFNSKVSCHYFIDKKGNLIQMVPDLYVAWHAGISKWKNDKLLNKSSIGIEISNPGHQYGYESFKKKQLECLIKISKILIKKYSIKKKNILGHSDIAPERKKDPGEKFPWESLSKKKLSVWHKLKEKNLKKLRRLKTNKIEKRKFFKNVKDIGYSSTNKMAVIQAFQRRFRQNLINGIVDQECLQISNSLL